VRRPLASAPGLKRNLGADYKGYWHDELRERVFVTIVNFLNHLKLYFFYIVVTYWFDSADNGTL